MSISYLDELVRFGGEASIDCANKSTVDLTEDQAKKLAIVATGATTAACTLRLPALKKGGQYLVYNNTTGGNVVVFKFASGGSTVSVAPGASKIVLARPGYGTFDVSSGDGVGVFSGMPTAGVSGRRYVVTDGPIANWVDNGTDWRPIVDGVVGKKPPLIGSFTWDNQGSSVVDYVGGAMVLTPKGVGANGLYASAPATPWGVTACLALGYGADAEDFGAGLFFRSTDEQLHTFGYVVEAGGGSFLVAKKWTDSGTPLTNYVLKGISGVPHRAWLRIENDGTNLKSSFSADGYNFALIHSVAKTDFLTDVSQWGLYGLEGIADGGATVSVLSLEVA